jgi:cytochrome o ubiquinol oxidase subunit III
VPVSERGPAPVRIVVSYGFWIFLLSDFIMFSAFFATYAVLQGQTAGGPAAKAFFELRGVAVETACLLLSTYACALGVLAVERGRMAGFFAAFAVTFVLGASFVGLEVSEFARMVAAGAAPSRSAGLSSFFALVGLHGVHVSVGLVWLAFITAQLAVQGRRDALLRRLRCFALFWHALDIIWVAIFSMIYLLGAA